MTKYLTVFIITICLIFYSQIDGQHKIADFDAASFQLKHKGDTINFLKISTDLSTIKPTLVFCQGSLPIPLVLYFNDGGKMITGVSNFDYGKLSEKYNIILISMPHIPLVADENHINKSQFAYITDSTQEMSYPQAYSDANFLENYVERGNAVVNFLTHQKWVDKSRIFLVGHSQGARIAAKIAGVNKNISALGFLAGNPTGRADQYIREYRLQQAKGKLSEQEAQEKIDSLYKWWSWLNDHKNEASTNGEDSPRSTLSFSVSIVSDLISLKIPIFIGYGTQDIVAANCDFLPLEFIRSGKTNYKMKRYLGLEHNFAELDKDGNPDFDKRHWQEVMDDFIHWIEDGMKN